MSCTNREQPAASQSMQCEIFFPSYSPCYYDKQVRRLKVVACLVCLFLMVGLPSGLIGRADAGDEIMVPSGMQRQVDIEQVVSMPIAIPETRRATLVRYSPIASAPEQFRVMWDFYLDNTWSILGGDVAQSLASAVQDLQSSNGAELGIEAYCDDRGSSAYSLVIGDRWLSKVESYLVSLGASPSNLSTISFGKERLLCHGSSGQCWEANLRLRETFRLMAIDQSEDGCLIRVNRNSSLRQVKHETSLNGPPSLQRLHISLPTLIPIQ